jgi:hypothetical protein
MNRYSTAQIIKDTQGRRKFESIILPAIPVTPEDTVILTTSIERLDKLAYTAYGDESYWWYLASCNGLGKGSIVVPPNTPIRIPSRANLEDYIRTINLER